MMSPRFRLAGCVMVLGLVWGCQSTAVPSEPADYFPLQTGHFVIYDVSEQRYSLTDAPVSLTYQLKEVTGAAYADVTGQSAYRLLRYRRSTGNQPWQLDSVWSARRTLTEAIRTENGRDIVKLVFPVIENARWNANRLNAGGSDEYQLRNVGQRLSVPGNTTAETATVVQQADSTLLGQDKRREIYARDIGMIYREIVQVQFCTATPDCIGKKQITYGSQQIYRIRDYGRE